MKRITEDDIKSMKKQLSAIEKERDTVARAVELLFAINRNLRVAVGKIGDILRVLEEV